MLRSILGKTLLDSVPTAVGWTVLAALFGSLYLALYPSIGAVEEMRRLLDSMPPAIRALFAAEGADLGTAAGYLNVELFAFVVPLLVAALTITAGAGVTAGEEERGSLDVLLAQPVPRWRVVAEKAIALAIVDLIVVAGLWIGLAATATVVGVDLALDRVAAALVSAGLLGLVLGGVAMLVGAATGRRMLAIGAALAIAVLGFFVNALAPLVEGLRAWRDLSPHYHYIGDDPLTNGLAVDHAAILAIGALALALAATVIFQRRDLRA